MDNNKNLKKVAVATAFVAATSLSATVVSALEEDQTNTQNTVVETTSLSETSSASDVQTGWVEEDGEKYYYNDQGEKVTGIQEIDGKFYYFDYSGALNVASPGGYWISDIDGKKIKVDDQGEIVEVVDIVANQWIIFDGGKYYYDDDS